MLLARVFLKEADPDLLRALTRAEITEVLELLEPGFTTYVRNAGSERELDELAAEFAGLFLLPRGIPPYAASWMEGDEGTVRARLEDQISLLYQSLQMEPADIGLGNVPADHIGMLLALTSVALEREASGGLAGRSTALFEAWAPAFAAGVIREAKSPLYRAAARLLIEVLELQGDRKGG